MVTLAWIVGSLVALVYIGAPMVIKFTLKIKARSTFLPIEPKDMPGEAYEHFGLTAPALQSLGFTLDAYLFNPDTVANVSAYIALWTNRTTGQMAMASVMYVEIKSEVGSRFVVKKYTEYYTKGGGGDAFAVLTNNSVDLGSFKVVTPKDTLQLPAIQDLTTLYRVHQWRESRFLKPDAARFIPREGEAIDYFLAAFEYDVIWQGTQGRFRPLADGRYGPTWPGAFIMAWGELPPFKQFRQVLRDRRAARELRAAESSTGTPPRSVRITHDFPLRLPPGVALPLATAQSPVAAG